MEAKGTAIVTLPAFIKKKFGNEGFDKWLSALSPEAKQIYAAPILANSWFPLTATLTNPTKLMCDLFYKGNMEGAFECGQFSADHALTGIYKVFIKFGSPEFLVKRATVIFPTYYTPSTMEAYSMKKGSITIKITQFEDIHRVIENRIAGWSQRALTLCGCKNVNASITQSLTNKSPFTEITFTWQE